jgi:hypothetical protein
MTKTTLTYGLALAAGAFALRWLEYQYAVRTFSTEIYIVSPNTVKTHLAHLYEKLAVSRRTQAISKAKELRLIR